MSEETYQKFLSLVIQMEPENLWCDGEASPEEARDRASRLSRAWAALERELGFQVTTTEIWSRRMREVTG